MKIDSNAFALAWAEMKLKHAKERQLIMKKYREGR